MSVDATPSNVPHSGADPLLPYASSLRPQGAFANDPPSGECFRDGDLLIVSNNATLPAHCILCGADGWQSPIRLTFTWDASFTITRESTLQLRQQAAIRAYLCVNHRARWSVGRTGGSIGFVTGMLLMAVGIAVTVLSETSAVPAYTPMGIALIVLGFAAIILAMFFFAFRTRTLSCKRIHEGYAYLQGASAVFLESLPVTHSP